MSIKPVELQVMIPKTSEVSRISSEHNQKNAALQQQQAATVQNKVDSNLKQVYSREGAQNAKIREKQEKSRKEGKEKSKEKKNSNSKSSKHNSSIQTSIIDIRL